MQISIRAIMVLAAFAVISALPAGSQAQEPEGYSFLSGISGPQVCIGQYRPPSSSNVTGFCDGQLLTVGQFSAVAARQSADRLDRIAAVLEAIDEKLAASNQQLQLLTEVSANAQAGAARSEIELLNNAIAERFESIPEEVIVNSAFREALDRLKADIMSEVEKRLSAPSKK
jgi:hypothetical protein